MPEPGDIVQWTFAPGQRMVPALVTGMGHDVISVILFPSETASFVRRECVRHVSDPWLKTHNVDPNYGVWEYTEESKKLHELYETLCPDKAKQGQKRRGGRFVA